MRVFTIITFILLSLSTRILAQQNQPSFIPDTPPSPQAVAFNRLGDYQLNNNYGVQDISIPLFEIDFHGYKIPLALHYEASPMKPGYNYDVTGLGWTLSGNSCVSRTIKGRADEKAIGKPFTLDSFNYSSGQPIEYLNCLYDKELDKFNFQYDSYNIVLPSGRAIPFFMYMGEGTMQYHTLSQDSNVKIACHYSDMTSFTVTDEKGITYNFTLPEKANNIFLDDVNAECYVTWLLTSIDIPFKGTICYEYEQAVNINQYNMLREPALTISRLYDPNGYCGSSMSSFLVKGYFQPQCPRYEMRLLKRISYGPSTVSFNYEGDKKHMQEIIVSDRGETIKKFKLNVYGSIPEYGCNLSSLTITGPSEDEKLEYGFTYHNNIPGDYADFWGNRCNAGPSKDNLGNFNIFFDYNGIGKGRNEIQQQLSSNGSISQLIENKEDDHSYYYKLKLQTTTDGDTRIPTTPEKHAILSSITYPNGGRTTFNFENNRFPTATAADGDLELDRRSQRIIEGGGFRIESIINWTADGKVANADYYRYGFTLNDIKQKNFPLPLPEYMKNSNISYIDTINHHVGCGEAVVDPNIMTFMSDIGCSLTAVYGTYNNSYSAGEFRKMLVGQDSRFRDLYNYSLRTPVWWDVTFSANKFRSLIGSRRPVVYPEITVYHGHPFELNECKSKTVYKYDIYRNNDPITGCNYLNSIYDSHVLDTIYFEPLYFQYGSPALSCMEYPSKRNQLKAKSDYSYNESNGKWELVSEEKYKYNTYDMSKEGFIMESMYSKDNYYPGNGLAPNQIGYSHPLKGIPLRSFYKAVSQCMGKSVMSEKSTTLFNRNGTRTDENTLTEKYTYLYPEILKKTSRITESNSSEEIHTYVGEVNSEGNEEISKMKQLNMLAYPLFSTEYSSDPYYNSFTYATYGSKTSYVSWHPFQLSEFNLNDDYYFEEDNVEEKVDLYEPYMEVISYDLCGNPTEIKDLRTEMHCVFIWDEYGRYLIAMIKNAKLEQISDIPALRAQNSQLRYDSLQALLPQSQVETWDYKPLVGVSSHTDITGNTTLYEYDGLGRLKSEKKIVKGSATIESLREHEYNFINKGY